jgi:hypothetical protein
MEDRPAAGSQTDALALRALAHPIRWKLMDVLTTEGTVTATRCSELTGESTATCSYHLGMLAKYGYITRVAGAHWREKPWRLVRSDLSLSAAGLDDEQAAASRAAAAAYLDYEVTRLKDSLRVGPEDVAGSQLAHKIMATTAWLTVEEVEQAMAEIGQVLDKYGDRGKAASDRPENARPTRLLAAVAQVPAGDNGA